MKDNFSTNSANYHKFRPDYPVELFDLIKSTLDTRINCWDCGTGNGQLALKLSGIFKDVYATDISLNQIKQAKKIPNINYSAQAAEKTNFPDKHFDLVIVGQAIHWFDFAAFYAEVKRTCKPNAWIIVTGYGLFSINKGIDKIIGDFYQTTLGAYWNLERKYIDQMYRSIPFPFPEMMAPSLKIEKEWTFKELIGYLNTWSAVNHYKNKNRINPIDEIENHLEQNWNSGQIKKVSFPMLLRIGKVNPD